MDSDRSLSAWAERYVDSGFSLVPLLPCSKVARGVGWNQRPLSSLEAVRRHWCRFPNDNIGLLHGNQTATLDIDNAPASQEVLKQVGLDLGGLLEGPCVLGLRSAKPLFRVPKGVALAPRRLQWIGEDGKPQVIFELRSGLVQDVLPPSVHPQTRLPYVWQPEAFVHLEELPLIPEPLLCLWQDWEGRRGELEALSPHYVPKKVGLPPGASAPGLPSLIEAFNAQTDLAQLLLAHGYVRRGKRFLAPHSSSGIPGISLGIFAGKTKLYSQHASDPLSATLHGGHTLDAFDVWCILEHSGDRRKALQMAQNSLKKDKPNMVKSSYG